MAGIIKWCLILAVVLTLTWGLTSCTNTVRGVFAAEANEGETKIWQTAQVATVQIPLGEPTQFISTKMYYDDEYSGYFNIAPGISAPGYGWYTEEYGFKLYYTEYVTDMLAFDNPYDDLAPYMDITVSAGSNAGDIIKNAKGCADNLTVQLPVPYDDVLFAPKRVGRITTSDFNQIAFNHLGRSAVTLESVSASGFVARVRVITKIEWYVSTARKEQVSPILGRPSTPDAFTKTPVVKMVNTMVDVQIGVLLAYAKEQVTFGGVLTVPLGNVAITDFVYGGIRHNYMGGALFSNGAELATIDFGGEIITFGMTYYAKTNVGNVNGVAVANQRVEHWIYDGVVKTVIVDAIYGNDASFADTQIVQTASDMFTFVVDGERLEYVLSEPAASVTITAGAETKFWIVAYGIHFAEVVATFTDSYGNIIAQIETVGRCIPTEMVPTAPERAGYVFKNWRATSGATVNDVITQSATFIPIYTYVPSHIISPPNDNTIQSPANGVGIGVVCGVAVLLIAGILILKAVRK